MKTYIGARRAPAAVPDAQIRTTCPGPQGPPLHQAAWALRYPFKSKVRKTCFFLQVTPFVRYSTPIPLDSVARNCYAMSNQLSYLPASFGFITVGRELSLYNNQLQDQDIPGAFPNVSGDVFTKW